MNPVEALLLLHDLDGLWVETHDPASASQLRKLGFDIGKAELLDRARFKLREQVDRRWLSLYERALQRYGHGLTLVRERVCQGCHLKLPTSAAPPTGEGILHLCEGCGRLLYWR